MPESTSLSPPRAPAAEPASGGRRRWLAMVVMSLGVSLVVVDATIVGVLLPQIVTELGLTTSDAEWVTSVYALVFAALLIPFGRAGDLFGRRRMFVLGVGVFAAASVVAALAGAGSALIGARALQGVGASMILPATLSTVHTVFTGRDRAVAFGIWGSMISGMAALGPLAGGALAAGGGWRWAFAINLPLGAALIVGALRLMPETRQGLPANARRDIDWTGGLLAALGLGALVCGIIEGPGYGWWAVTRPFSLGGFDWPESGLSPVPVVLALGVLLLAALVVVERSRAAAGRAVMLDLDLFRIPNFRRGNLASALVNVGELGLLFVLPLFLLGVHGTSPLQISVAILPLAVGAFLSGGYAGRLADRHGAHRVVQIGMVLEVAAVIALGLTVSASTGGLGLAPWMLLYGFGLGLTSAQLTNVSLADVPHARAGQASGTQSTARQVGAALGIAAVGTVFATSLGHAMTDRISGSALPPEERAAIVHDLRQSAGTYGRELHATPARAAEARAADASLAVATRHAALATAAILTLGLAMTLRLRPGGDRRTAESGGTTPLSAQENKR
ncbi:EmrB/QacA subfamily drug resistance transporter [Actinomadura pelletieri DSM 43383]|uniref:EmrB/QacA subfamily drug resistance transporter n=1 Tax=Actinomadura pelletieri DSM 43383 TaxID=1120940 RepID=A0A495QPK5_9ACTN|nr:MFS transporter [Actinomadura pelletieri]RKS74910.1 EmrB/QacA subfamily drug resistance transporter [Actinomadura pelletieri DSM 43383]